MEHVYRISSKSHHTSKSCSILHSQLIPINAALEILPHGTGSTTIYACAHALYVHTNRLITEAVYVRAYQYLCRRRSRNVAALELSPHGTAP